MRLSWVTRFNILLSPWTPPHNPNAHTGPGSNIPVISQSQPNHELDSDENESINDVSSPTTGDEEIDHNPAVTHCNAVLDRKIITSLTI